MMAAARAREGQARADIRRKVAEARAAQLGWGGGPLRERLRVLRRIRHEIAENADVIARAVDQGRNRPPGETLTAEVIPLADACRFLEKNAGRILATRRLGIRGRPLWLPGVQVRIRREPLGVVLVIGPANYPLFLPGVQALHALAAGNAVVLKPGRGGAAPALAFADCLRAAGLDPRLCPVLDESPEAAERAVEAGVDKVVLTGSVQTGRAVLSQLAPRIVPATMELSGCDAVYVLDDADVALAARALYYGLRLNRGATCISPRRAFVPRRLAGELEGLLTDLIRRGGPIPVEEGTAERLQLLVADALGKGARLVAGEVGDCEVTGPVILADVSTEMRLTQEDVMAPVLSLLPVSDMREALDASVRCPYALGASVFGPEEAALRVAAQVRAGVVVVNDVIVPTADPRVPFGGRGDSGFGVTRGADGLLEMTAPKAVLVRRGRWRPHLEPQGPALAQLAADYLATVHGRSALGRARALIRLVRGLWAARRSDAGHKMPLEESVLRDTTEQ